VLATSCPLPDWKEKGSVGKTKVCEELVVSSAQDVDPRLVRRIPIIRKKNDKCRIIKRSALCGNNNRLNGISQIATRIPLRMKLLRFSDPVDRQ